MTMKSFWNGTNKIGPLLILLFWIYNANAQSSSYYQQEFYTPISHPARHYFRRSNGFEPIKYARDLKSEETKTKVSSKKYAKPIPNKSPFASDEDDFSLERFHSSEYSNEARNIPHPVEQDSREYTIGTQIHVQHPITKPKKFTSSYAKPTKHSLTSDRDVSSEFQSSDSATVALPQKKRPSKFNHHYEPDPFHVIPPPKTTLPSIGSNNNSGYHVYETDYDDFKPPKKIREHYKSVASKKQIEQYFEDQQKKLLDDVLKTQLLNNPEFKEFLKQKERQRFEREHRQLYNDEEGLISPPSAVFLDNLEEGITFTTTRPRRRPSDFKRSPKRPIKPKRKYRSAVVIEV